MNYIRIMAVSAMMLLGTQVSIGQNKESKSQDEVKEKTSSIKQKSSNVSVSKPRSSMMIAEDQEMAGIRERLKTAKSNSTPK